MSMVFTAKFRANNAYRFLMIFLILINKELSNKGYLSLISQYQRELMCLMW